VILQALQSHETNLTSTAKGRNITLGVAR